MFKRFITSILLLTSATVAAQEPNTSVYRLSSSTGPGCGTAFWSSDLNAIVTNAHIANLWCQKGSCQDIEIRTASKIGEEPVLVTSKPVTLKVIKQYPALDVALLSPPPDWKIPSGIKLADVAVPLNTEVRLLGYPGCEKLELTSGKVEKIGPLHINTSAIGASGSSGSPILDSNGRLVGVAHQASSFSLALVDKLMGASFALRGARADYLKNFSTLNVEESLLREIELMLQFYKENVAPARDSDRLWAAIEFTNGAMNIRDYVLTNLSNTETHRAALMLERYPGLIALLEGSPPSSPTAQLIERLVFAANLELRGDRQDLLRALNIEKFQDALNHSGRSLEQTQSIVEILKLYISFKTPGMAALGAVITTGIALVLALLIALYGWTLGFVYAAEQGWILTRIWKMSLVALIFWPISFLVYLIIRAKRPKVK